MNIEAAFFCYYFMSLYTFAGIKVPGLNISIELGFVLKSFTMKKFIKYSLRALAVLVALLVLAFLFFNKKKPIGQPGEAAEQHAQNMLQTIDKTAWDSTDWVKWTYAGRNSFVWDKKNGVVQVKMGQTTVLLDTKTMIAQSWENGTPLHGEAAEKAKQAAWRWFCNDSFWLNAPAKILDSGTTRSTVALDNGQPGLMVQYATGGVTPGDAYLWELDANGLPRNYQMWVSVLPIGGISSTWENWVTLPTGAKIATKHTIGGLLTVEVTNYDAGRGVAPF